MSSYHNPVGQWASYRYCCALTAWAAAERAPQVNGYTEMKRIDLQNFNNILSTIWTFSSMKAHWYWAKSSWVDEQKKSELIEKIHSDEISPKNSGRRRAIAVLPNVTYLTDWETTFSEAHLSSDERKQQIWMKTWPVLSLKKKMTIIQIWSPSMSCHLIGPSALPSVMRSST